MRSLAGRTRVLARACQTECASSAPGEEQAGARGSPSGQGDVLYLRKKRS